EEARRALEAGGGRPGEPVRPRVALRGGGSRGVNDRTRPTRAPTLQPRQHDGGWQLVDELGAVRCSLNDTAVALWELCDGTTSVAEMAAAVQALFRLDPAVADREVKRTLAELGDVGAIDDA